VIRNALVNLAYENKWFDGENLIRKNVKLIYGGSVNEENIGDFLTRNAVDGVLVGGASLDFKKLINLIKTIKRTSND
jgi:triosephosphate isomerase